MHFLFSEKGRKIYRMKKYYGKAGLIPLLFFVKGE